MNIFKLFIAIILIIAYRSALLWLSALHCKGNSICDRYSGHAGTLRCFNRVLDGLVDNIALALINYHC